jgi:hypothetical protein
LFYEGVEWLREEVAETLILTYEANAISTELGQDITFEPVIVPALVLGDKTKRSKASIIYLIFLCLQLKVIYTQMIKLPGSTWLLISLNFLRM